MVSFRERYCSRHRCTAQEFERRVFWTCLYPHARLPARLILWLSYDFFSADRVLVACAGDVTSMRRLREEIHDFARSPENHRWLRHSARLRVSGRRLQQLGRDYLPENGAIHAEASCARPPVVSPSAPA